MKPKIEFASPAWLSALRDLLVRYTRAAGPEVELSICEVFTGVPPHLDEDGDGVIAWHCHIANGEVRFEEGEIDDADLKTFADYDFVLRLARMKIEDSTMEEYRRLQALGAETGKLRSNGGYAKVPASFHGMHNELAEVTA